MATSNASLSSKIAAQGGQMTPLAIKDELKQWKEKNMAVMAQLLGDKDKAEKLYIATCYAISQIPALAGCSKQSLVNCMMQSCYTGLFPGSLQEADYVPYKGVATFVPRYGGLVGLAEQTGMYSGFSANVVYEQDEFDFQEGSEPYLRHRKSLGAQKDRGERVAAYASCKSRTGTPIFVILTMDEIESIKKRSAASGSKFSPWSNGQEFDYDEMCKKTALKRLSKLLKKSPQLAKAIELDNASENPELAKPTIPGFGEFETDASVAPTEHHGEGIVSPSSSSVGGGKPPSGDVGGIGGAKRGSHYLQDQPGYSQEQELAAQEGHPMDMGYEQEVESHISAIAKPKEGGREILERAKERAAKEAASALPGK